MEVRQDSRLSLKSPLPTAISFLQHTAPLEGEYMLEVAARGVAPDNSLPNIEHAIELSLPLIELDLRAAAGSGDPGMLESREIRSDVSSREPARVRQQLRLVRSMGVHGYCLFVYGYLNDAITEMLRSDINQESAVPYFR